MKKYLTIGVTIVFVLLCACCTGSASNKSIEDKSESKVDSVQEMHALEAENEYDGDPEISGSSRNLGTIMQSIADGDAKRLASLALYPIKRKYPLRNINDANEMIQRFDQIFDNDFRNRMKSSKASDWHSYGWRGYSIGDDNALWVFDLLYAINYYSVQELALYEQLVKTEIGSLHKSLQGGNWYPFCCYKDLSDGSIIRIDIRAKKALKEENFHKGGVALAYQQLPAFNICGDEEFRMSIYPKGYPYHERFNLSVRPQMVLMGYVEISGSANSMQYMLSKEGVEIEFGDDLIEDGKQFLVIKKNGEETLHEIKSCYWLDLIKR